MRETCARVLAAALMTGAIAATLAMPAIFDSAREAGRSLTAPPTSLQRSVRVPALAVPAQTARRGRPDALSVRNARSPAAPAHPAREREAIAASKANPHVAGSGRATAKPRVAAIRELAAETPAPAALPPAHATNPPAPTAAGGGACPNSKAKGKAKGHCKPNQNAPRGEAAPTPQPPVAPAPPAAPPEQQPQSDSKDHGNGHGNGHGKQEAED